jgi:formylmethanofuran dehydrogenase subunit C
LKEITFKLKHPLTVPVDASCISPDILNDKTNQEILSFELWEGNRKIRVSDIFTVEGDAHTSSDDLEIRLAGDMKKVRRIGHRMMTGTIEIKGDVGMHLGEEMSGGKIIVNGNAGSWVGSRMKGGSIEIHGNAGDFVGSAYRGSRNGMKGGSIIIEGNAGAEIGCWMRGGMIRVKGKTGTFPAVHMSNGTILVEGDCDGRAGAQMSGGKVVVLGRLPSILPSFIFEDIKEKVKVAEEKLSGPFYTFLGDISENGTGRLSVKVSSNPQLKWCESYTETLED